MRLMTRGVALVKSKCVVHSLNTSISYIQNSSRLLDFRDNEIRERPYSLMRKVGYIGLDVHKESIVVAIAPAGDTEVRNYGIINGTLDALGKSDQETPPTRRPAALCL
jgi:hypothetical protein